MNNQSSIERTVMRRVHLIRILKLIISTAVFAGLAFTATLWGIGREVWVARVFENAPAGPEQFLSFYLAAFTHTRFIVQALTVLTLLSLVFLTRETIRFFSSSFTSAHT